VGWTCPPQSTPWRRHGSGGVCWSLTSLYITQMIGDNRQTDAMGQTDGQRDGRIALSLNVPPPTAGRNKETGTTRLTGGCRRRGRRRRGTEDVIVVDVVVGPGRDSSRRGRRRVAGPRRRRSRARGRRRPGKLLGAARRARTRAAEAPPSQGVRVHLQGVEARRGRKRSVRRSSCEMVF